MELFAEEVGESDRRPLVSSMECPGELSEKTEGAVGGDVDAGTEARYSAPPLGTLFTLPTLLRLLRNACVGERSLLL
jgi:hypothetical protein